MASDTISFFVNGRKKVLANPDPDSTLLHYLRRQLRLTGTKEGCGEGGCGACTVMISKYDPHNDRTSHSSVNACLLPICSVDELAITTIEGIGSTRSKLHPCQERIALGHGSQCGFCTPGMVMSMYTLLRNNPQPLETEVEEALQGNLCRCTGYRPILDAFRTFCCSPNDADRKEPDDSNHLIDPTQEVIFPPELKVNKVIAPLFIHGPRAEWHRPIRLDQLLTLKEEKTQSQIVAGGLTLGLQINQGSSCNPVLIAVSHIPELHIIQETAGEGLLVGAMVTISELEWQLKKTIEQLPGDKVRRLVALLEMLSWYAGPQIKHIATVGGNIMNPNSDIITALKGMRATVQITSKNSQREVVFDSAEKTLDLEANEILVSILIPLSEEDEQIAVFKQTRRKHLDSAIVNACLWMKTDAVGIIKDCQLVYGGVATSGVSVAIDTERKMIGRKLNNDLLSVVCQSLVEEFNLPPDRGMVDYRISLCLSFFYKFYLQVLSTLSTPLADSVSEREQSGLKKLPQKLVMGSQGFQPVSSDQFVGQPLMHLSALQQATGEAKYVDDIPCIDGEGHAGLILSEAAHALITVDHSGLEGMEGVLEYISAKDVPSCNVIGLANDDYIFADKEVTSVGQIIGIVVAKSKPLAQRASEAVKVTYSHLPAILTTEEAIAAKSFYKPECRIRNGNVEVALKSAEYVKEGQMRLGGQEQFYMETFACLAIPKGENNEIEIIASTQNPSDCQNSVAKALGVPKNRVTVKVTRLGGGFGGKETRCHISYAAVAVAANKLQIPIRMMMTRREDMIHSGARHPFLGKYKVGFNKDGKLDALDIDIYLNGGATQDLSIFIMEGALLSVQSVYYIPNANIEGHVCHTNLPSNTAMRGFGTPEALMMMETVLSDVADTLNVDKMKIQELNFLEDGQEFAYGMKVENCTIQRCLDCLLAKCQYSEKKKEIEEFNKKNRWKKRGIAVVPTLHGMGFYEYLTFNQAGALVHVYTDGSVLLTHGGVEMGQGLHTKMVQVCAKCLNIPVEKIHICETSTDKVPNTTPTAASVSTDLNGMAVQNACEQILSEIKPFKDQRPDGTWEEWVEAAYIGRASLSARGFYKTPDFGIKFTDDGFGRGNAYLYHTYGVGCSTVEVDTLTGSSQVLRSDLVMDVGNSLNPAIDIGQVEGAFTQGLGLFTMEELVFLPDGQLYTHGPSTYKIPGCSDIPIELNVTLLDRCPNPKAIFSSKGIGEPPLFLAASVFFAIKEAVKSARAENRLEGYFEFWSPATTEKIRLACQDQFTDMVKSSDNKWSITP